MASLSGDPELASIVERPAQNIWIGPGGHVITHPVSAGAGIYMGVTTADMTEDDAFWSAAVEKSTLLERFAAWDPRVLRLIEAAPPATGYGLHDSTPLEHWSVGRVCLLGDACHPMLPFQAQGAAQAVEDGAVLADVLRGVGSSGVPAALARYVDARRPRASRVQAASRANGALWHLDDGPAATGARCRARLRCRRLHVVPVALGLGTRRDAARARGPGRLMDASLPSEQQVPKAPVRDPRAPLARVRAAALGGDEPERVHTAIDRVAAARWMLMLRSPA